MRLGGWSRIGVVISALYAALVVFVAYETRPKAYYLHSNWISDAADVIAERLSEHEKTTVYGYQVREALLNKGEQENIAWLKKVAASPSEKQKLFSAEVAKVNQKHEAAISSFPAEQRTHWLLALAWLFGGVAVVFGSGWTVRWIYRGFRQTPV